MLFTLTVGHSMDEGKSVLRREQLLDKTQMHTSQSDNAE